MKSKKIGDKYFVRIDKGEEVVTSLKKFCLQNNVKLASLTGIGAADRVIVGLFNTETKQYHDKEFVGEYEITNISGNITTKNGETYFHLHITLGDEKHRAYGGHLNEAWISGTCEIVINCIDGNLERKYDENCGLNIFSID